MRYTATADSDVGISKSTNQDSVLIKHASTEIGEVLMAIVCDGMGGLAKGELASATVIDAFSKWFDEEFPLLANSQPEDYQLRSQWENIIRTQNEKIKSYLFLRKTTNIHIA